jgi:protein SCO1/2
MMKHCLFRFRGFWLPGLLLVAGLVSASVARAAPMTLEDFEVGRYAIGGDFTLTSQLGQKVRLSQYRGKVVALFFGYTYCPDVCPTTLSDFQKMQKLLGKEARRVQPLFITVDPARDTAPRLKSYLANFSGGTVGLTGTESEIRAVATLYQARFARNSTAPAGGYLMDHTGFIYLLDGTGKVRYVITPDAGGDLMAEGARRLLKEQG